MGPLCNLSESKITDIRLVKINKANLINNFRSTNQCPKKEKESAEEDWLAKELWHMYLFIISKLANISQLQQRGDL